MHIKNIVSDMFVGLNVFVAKFGSVHSVPKYF